jgi:hypothetical protein
VQLRTDRGGCKQRSSRRSSRETVHIRRNPVIFIRRSDKQFEEGRSTNFAPVSFDRDNENEYYFGRRGLICASRPFTIECLIREDSGHSISCFGRTT